MNRRLAEQENTKIEEAKNRKIEETCWVAEFTRDGLIPYGRPAGPIRGGSFLGIVLTPPISDLVVVTSASAYYSTGRFN